MSTYTPPTETPHEISLLFNSFQSFKDGISEAIDNQFSRRSVSGAIAAPLQNGTTDQSKSDTFLSEVVVSSTCTKPGRLSLTEQLSRGSLGTVYRCLLDHTKSESQTSTSFIIKFVAEKDKLVLLRHEAIIYQYGKHLQGSVLPHCFGLYENKTQTTGFILLEDCGKPFGKPFGDLSDKIKLVLMQALKQLHDAGIEHGDLQPWNILDHRESLRIVDWHLAMVHQCPARDQVMTDEFCFSEAVSELACDELATVGERMLFRSQNDIFYGEEAAE